MAGNEEFTREQAEEVAREAAAAYGIDPELFIKQLRQESGLQHYDQSGNVKSSPAGARGVAQIVPASHPKANYNDPVDSIWYAADLMSKHLARYSGDYKKALAAYNAGGGTVDNFVQSYGASWLQRMGEYTRPRDGAKPFVETVQYVRRITGDDGPDPGVGEFDPVERRKYYDNQVVSKRFRSEGGTRFRNPGINDNRSTEEIFRGAADSDPFSGMAQHEAEEYLPFSEPSRGGVKRAGRNVLRSMGFNPDAGSPYVGKLLSNVGPLAEEAQLLHRIEGGDLVDPLMGGRAASPDAAIAERVKSGLLEGRTGPSDPLGLLEQLRGLEQRKKSQQDLTIGQSELVNRYSSQLQDNGQSSTPDFNSLGMLMKGSYAPILRGGVSDTLKGMYNDQYLDVSAREPGLSFLDFLLRAYGR